MPIFPVKTTNDYKLFIEAFSNLCSDAWNEPITSAMEIFYEALDTKIEWYENILADPIFLAQHTQIETICDEQSNYNVLEYCEVDSTYDSYFKEVTNLKQVYSMLSN
jgi:hypothetical protein